MLKADRTEAEALKEKIDDLESRFKRNNVVIWGVQEGSEKDFASMEEFNEIGLFQSHINFERKTEVIRAHRSSLKRRANARNVSFSISVRWSIYIVNSVDKPNFRKTKSL